MYGDLNSLNSVELSVIKIKEEDIVETYYPDPHNVNTIRYELVKALSKKWLEMTGGK
jgi:hypothetical protein